MTNNNDTFHFNSFGQDFDLVPRFSTYAAGGRTCLEFWYEAHDEMGGEAFSYWEPFAKVTVNMPEDHLNEGEFFVKDWAENEALVAHLVEQGWIISTGREVLSGYVAPGVYSAAGPLKEFLDNLPQS